MRTELGVLEVLPVRVKSSGTIQRIVVTAVPRPWATSTPGLVWMWATSEYSLVMCTFYGDDSRYWMVAGGSGPLHSALPAKLRRRARAGQPTFSDARLPTPGIIALWEMAAEKGLFAGTRGRYFARPA